LYLLAAAAGRKKHKDKENSKSDVV